MPARDLAATHRTALVTGAASGLGLAFTRMLLSAGVEVWGTSRHPQKLPHAAGFHPVHFDLAGGDSAADELIRNVEQQAGSIELLVHNAGYGIFGRLLDHPPKVWRAQVDEMLGVSLSLNRAGLASMAPRRRGTIVNVTSMAVEFPLPYMAGYNVAKAGLAALCESLLLEADPLGINVLDFRPGDYRTGFNQSMYASLPADLPHQVRRIGIHLDRLLAEAPLPEKAASDLYRALRNRRSGVVRSGTFFQTALAPFLVRFCTQRLRRFFMNRHFGAT